MIAFDNMADKAYRRELIFPVVSQKYDGDTVKYRCPICKSFGIHIQVLPNVHEKCPVCGVNLVYPNRFGNFCISSKYKLVTSNDV